MRYGPLIGTTVKLTRLKGFYEKHFVSIFKTFFLLPGKINFIWIKFLLSR
jgi:hypothetical protein